MAEPSPIDQGQPGAHSQQDTHDSHDQPHTAKKPRGQDRRKSIVDRRTNPTGLERRRGPGRRRTDFMKAAEEGEMSQEQFLFLKAIDAYKRVNNRPYPTWSEVLEVIRKLGYRKTSPMTLDLPAAEDWTEAPDAPAFPESQSSDNDEEK